MDAPVPDPNKLLQSWMEWEKGEVTPGRVMANMKTGGLRQLLEALVAAGGAPLPGAGPEGAVPARSVPGPLGDQPPTWTPVV